MWYWMNFARQDLFPSRRFRPYSLFSWMPALVLVVAVAAVIGLGVSLDASLRGARSRLEDPEALRRVPVDALRESRADHDFLDLNTIRALERLTIIDPGNRSRTIRPVRSVVPYTTEITLSFVRPAPRKSTGDQGPADEEEIVDNTYTIRTTRPGDPLLDRLEWIGPHPRVTDLFQGDDSWGLVVNEGLLKRLKMEKTVEQALREGRDRYDPARQIVVETTVPGGFETQRFAIPILGVVREVPGFGGPGALAVEAFVSAKLAGKLSPNPYVTEVSFDRPLSVEQIRDLNDRWMPRQGKHYQFIWADSRDPVDPATLARFARAGGTQAEVLLLPARGHSPNAAWKNLLDTIQADLADSGLVDRARFNPPGRRLEGGYPLQNYKYADVYINNSDYYIDVADAVRALDLSVDAEEYALVKDIHERFGFFRRVSSGLVLSATIVMGTFLTFLLILLTHFRAREIAVFRTQGAGASEILAIYSLKGLIVWTVGTALGLAIGAVQWPLWLRAVIQAAVNAPVDNLPILAALASCWTVVALALAACLAGSAAAALFALRVSHPTIVLRG